MLACSLARAFIYPNSKAINQIEISSIWKREREGKKASDDDKAVIWLVRIRKYRWEERFHANTHKARSAESEFWMIVV